MFLSKTAGACQPDSPLTACFLASKVYLRSVMDKNAKKNDSEITGDFNQINQ